MGLVLAVMALGLAAPAASADFFEVNDSSDEFDGSCNGSGGFSEVDFDCTLRDAIKAANLNVGVDDDIVFEFPEEENETVTITPECLLPAITDEVTIDGTTHPGPDAATKGIELDGSDVTSCEVSTAQIGDSGLVVENGPATIRGLAINGFPENGIHLIGDGNTIVDNYIGTDPSGEEPVANGRGIEVESEGNEIGGTGDGDRNVISGNSGVGILFHPLLSDGGGGDDDDGTVSVESQEQTEEEGRDEGEADDDIPDGVTTGPDEGGGGPDELPTDGEVSGEAQVGPGVVQLVANTNTVSGNYIGTGANGRQDLGNGEGGIVIEDRDGTAVGAEAPRDGNRIAFNGGPGVAVQGDAVGNEISRNSIFSNSGLGIDLDNDGPTANDSGDSDTGGNNRQNFPELLAAQTTGGTTEVEGALQSTGDTEFRIEFFSDRTCDPSDFGEGRRFLGEENVTTGDGGSASFTAQVEAPPSGHDVVTATATNVNSGDTSEFSNCITPTQGGGGGSGGNGGGGNGGGGGSGGDDDDDTSVTQRVSGLIAASIVGNIYVKPPGATTYHLLQPGETIPFGSIVNAIHGRVRLSVIGPNGETDTAEFYGGAFRITQAGVVAAQTGAPPRVIDLRLIGGDYSGCTPVRRLQAPSTKAIVRRSARRRVWGSGRGRFRTSGRYAAATVRGTVWLTEDRCDGTLIVVRSGVVSVFDRVLRKTVLVRAGHTYLARAQRPS